MSSNKLKILNKNDSDIKTGILVSNFHILVKSALQSIHKSTTICNTNNEIYAVIDYSRQIINKYTKYFNFNQRIFNNNFLTRY